MCEKDGFSIREGKREFSGNSLGSVRTVSTHLCLVFYCFTDRISISCKGRYSFVLSMLPNSSVLVAAATAGKEQLHIQETERLLKCILF